MKIKKEIGKDRAAYRKWLSGHRKMRAKGGISATEAKRYWQGYGGKTTEELPIGVRLINYTFEAPHGFDEIAVKIWKKKYDKSAFPSGAAAAAEGVK